MSDELTADLCVIGAGAGGLSVAAAAAALGAPTVLIEKNEMGGAVLNGGCLHSKALAAAAQAAHRARGLQKFGLAVADVSVDFSAVMDHVRETVRAASINASEERCRALGVHLVHGAARFVARDRVEAGGRSIRARRFIIATGSVPAPSGIPGLEQIRHFTTSSIFSLTSPPRRLVVAGSEPAGVELAQAFARLGVQVILIDPGRILAREEDEFADPVRMALVADGVDLRENVRIARAQAQGDGFVLSLESGETIEGTHLLLAAGRRPDVEGLGLEAARVRRSPDGIVVREDLRTSNRRIYCIGDAAGFARSAQAATHHARLVLRSTLFRLGGRVVPGLIPRVLYTDPGIAAAGLSEAEARKIHGRIQVLRWPLADNDRARAEGVRQGHVKVVLSRGGVVLGASVVGPDAAEMIALWVLAIARKTPIEAIAGLVLPYPTLAETAKQAAITARAPALASPWLRSLLGVLRKFG